MYSLLSQRKRFCRLLSNCLKVSSLNLRQHILELGVVHLHAIIEVDGNHLVDEMMDLLLVRMNFRRLVVQRLQLLRQLHAF